MRRAPEHTRPEYRQLRIYAIDPMVERSGDHQVTAQIRWEDLDPEKQGTQLGPDLDAISLKGRRVEVVDVDASGPEPLWLKPVDLDDPYIASQLGLEPSESDPQFHQQMVYAVAMRTLEQFDRALGRIVYFKGHRRLRLVPHAFRGANAFYHPSLRAVLFGWFRASEVSPGENLPGQTIFTCLSHDIIAHEVTHAILDRLRPHFNVATNPHVRAFHEALADIVAVFQRLTFRDLVQRALQDARGDPTQSKLLSNIATQFGQGLGGGESLRSAIDAPQERRRIQDVTEEHELGAVLVAAVFEGFLRTYQRRSADLLRIATGGTGILPQGALPTDLVARLTTECVRTAQSVLTMCVRAVDYLPPADVTFGSFLRAFVTADWELNPLDETGLRAAMIEACRQRGIFAADAGALAAGALLLDSPPAEQWLRHRLEFQNWVDLMVGIGVDEQRAQAPEDEDDSSSSWEYISSPTSNVNMGPPVESSFSPDEDGEEVPRSLRERIMTWFASLPVSDRERIGMREDSQLVRIGFHQSNRIASDGTLRFGLVVQLVEMQLVPVLGLQRLVPSGATLVIDVNGAMRFVICTAPIAERARDLGKMARIGTTDALGWKLTPEPSNPFAVDYRAMHEGRTA